MVCIEDCISDLTNKWIRQKAKKNSEQSKKKYKWHQRGNQKGIILVL